jgi:hypothetical protein
VNTVTVWTVHWTPMTPSLHNVSGTHSHGTANIVHVALYSAHVLAVAHMPQVDGTEPCHLRSSQLVMLASGHGGTRTANFCTKHGPLPLAALLAQPGPWLLMPRPEPAACIALSAAVLQHHSRVM